MYGVPKISETQKILVENYFEVPTSKALLKWSTN
jgi:hypothetical protein